MEVQPNGISQWAFDDTIVDGRVTIDKPSAKLLAAVAAAEAAGALTVKASKDERAKMAAAVESDSDSLKAQAKAMDDGSWHYGNHEAFLTQARHLLADKKLSDETRVRLEAGVQVSERYLQHRRDEIDHDNAVLLALNPISSGNDAGVKPRG